MSIAVLNIGSKGPAPRSESRIRSSGVAGDVGDVGGTGGAFSIAAQVTGICGVLPTGALTTGTVFASGEP